MKISELIDKLNELFEEHGDHEIEINDIDMEDLQIIPPCNNYPYSLICQKNKIYGD